MGAGEIYHINGPEVFQTYPVPTRLSTASKAGIPLCITSPMSRKTTQSLSAAEHGEAGPCLPCP